MALATQADVEARLGRALTADEETRIAALLSDASSLVVGFTGQDFEPMPYPAPVEGVVAQMVVRVLAQGAAGSVVPEQQSAGPFAVRNPAWATTSGSPWLSATDKVALRPYRRGMTSVQLVGERYTITES